MLKFYEKCDDGSAEEILVYEFEGVLLEVCEDLVIDINDKLHGGACVAALKRAELLLDGMVVMNAGAFETLSKR